MTRATDEKPTRRTMRLRDGKDLVIELLADVIVMRPKGSRRGGPTEVTVTPGAVYTRAIMSQVDAEKAAKRRGPLRVKRGLL